MRSPLSISMVIHVLVSTLSIFGLPFLYKSPAKQQKPMVVEVVSIGNKTELPKLVKENASKQVEERKKNTIKHQNLLSPPYIPHDKTQSEKSEKK